MPWSRSLTSSYQLKDGRAIATLADARELLLSLPVRHQENEHWIFAASLLLDANDTTQKSDIEAATVQMGMALRIEGLL
jgi:hypothetical protein